MGAPQTRRWSLSRPEQRDTSNYDPFSARLDEVIDLIRACDLDRAHRESLAIRDEARAVSNDVAAGRAYSFLGEIAGIRGQLESAMRDYGLAIEHLERTELAGSISRAYRGWAFCYLTFKMPRLALQPAREATRIAAFVEVADVKRRAEFECAICEGLVAVELQEFAEATERWELVAPLIPTMAAVDDWLPGLHSLLGGRILIERGARTSDETAIREGVAELERVVAHFRASGLRFWQAWALESLGRAQEESDADAATRRVREAMAIYREVGAEHLFEGAEQWLRNSATATPPAYGDWAPALRPPRLAPDADVVDGQVLAGPKTTALVERAVRFARLVHPVLMMGESGTGKEGLARIIHRASGRTGQFVPVNCAAIPESLLESMLFGHRKGVFTGATSNHAGMVHAARDGTIFLDEIGDMPLALQPKLLRFLESGCTLSLGDSLERRVDVRVIAATNQNLEEAVSDGRFREDLYYRLNVLRLNTIPLRERMEEVARLAQHLAAECDARLTIGAINALGAYDWPGNVRQLRNVLFRALGYVDELPAVFTRAVIEETLAAERRSSIARNNASPASPSAARDREGERGYAFLTADGELPAGMSLPAAEREFMRYHIARALARHNGNKTRAARELGLKLQTLHVRAKKLGLG
jgi:DNA-binding NtrC family response regulator